MAATSDFIFCCNPSMSVLLKKIPAMSGLCYLGKTRSEELNKMPQD